MTTSYELFPADHLAWYDHYLLLPGGRGANSLFPMMARLRRWRYARRLRSPGSQSALGPRTLELGPETVREFTDLFDFSTRWRDVAFVSLTPTHLFIAHSSMNAHIVPLRGFGSVATREEFVAFAQQHAPVVAL